MPPPLRALEPHACTTFGAGPPLVGLLIAWCATLRHRPVMLALHENSKGFDGLVLQELLGDVYSIVELQVCPAQVGFAFLRRPRRYHVLVHRRQARVVQDIQHSYQVIVPSVSERPVGGWHWRSLVAS